jgi:hypothetical protein
MIAYVAMNLMGTQAHIIAKNARFRNVRENFTVMMIRHGQQRSRNQDGRDWPDRHGTSLDFP